MNVVFPFFTSGALEVPPGAGQPNATRSQIFMCGPTPGLHFAQFSSDEDDSPPALQGLHTLLFFSLELVLIPLFWISHSICKKNPQKNNKDRFLWMDDGAQKSIFHTRITTCGPFATCPSMSLFPFLSYQNKD